MCCDFHGIAKNSVGLKVGIAGGWKFMRFVGFIWQFEKLSCYSMPEAKRRWGRRFALTLSCVESCLSNISIIVDWGEGQKFDVLNFMCLVCFLQSCNILRPDLGPEVCYVLHDEATKI